jgi:hypothetical protein
LEHNNKNERILELNILDKKWCSIVENLEDSVLGINSVSLKIENRPESEI